MMLKRDFGFVRHVISVLAFLIVCSGMVMAQTQWGAPPPQPYGVQQPYPSPQYPQAAPSQYPPVSPQQYPQTPPQYPGAGPQQYPPGPAQPYPPGTSPQYPAEPAQQYPAPPPSYPQAQPQQPPFGGQPSQFAPSGPGPVFSDALGRFRVNLPQGAVPMAATYTFTIPSALCQVSINSVNQDQMFQMVQQNVSNTMKQMGARLDADQPMDAGGRQGRIIAATARDPMSGQMISSLNVFIFGVNIWVQVMGPEQNAQQLGPILQAILGSLQF